jgi:hypothetical protein
VDRGVVAVHVAMQDAPHAAAVLHAAILAVQGRPSLRSRYRPASAPSVSQHAVCTL